MLIIALPFAGASRNCYREFNEELSNIITIEYPGKGSKSNKSLPLTIQELIDEIIVDILHSIGNNDYILFGHSMGGIIAYEVCKQLEQRKKPPTKLIISGLEFEGNICHLNSNEFWEEILMFGLIPKEILNNKDALSYFENLLRADFNLLKSHVPTNRCKTPVKILFCEGLHFPFNKWKNISSSIEFIRFKGNNHFFIFNNKSIINYLYQQCSN